MFKHGSNTNPSVTWFMGLEACGSLVMGMRNLMEKIEYCLEHPMEENVLKEMFSDTEWNILSAMRSYKQRQSEMNAVFSQEKYASLSKMELDLEKMDYEKEAILHLKKSVIIQLDILLAAGTIEAWCEMLIWYKFIIQEKLPQRFFEFYVLKIVLDVFVQECNCREFNFLSAMQMHSMKEVQNAFFRTVFMLRRIEYDIEPLEEVCDYIRNRGFSDIYLLQVLKEGQINNKDKVRKAIESWRMDGGG